MYISILPFLANVGIVEGLAVGTVAVWISVTETAVEIVVVEAMVAKVLLILVFKLFIMFVVLICDLK